MNKIKFKWKNIQESEINFSNKDPQELILKLLNTVINKIFIVMDEVVANLYPNLKSSINMPLLILGGGEDLKNLSIIEKIICFLHENHCLRSDLLIVIGGGCLGDTAGFAASIYKRGIQWVFFPTTLIAQVDSSIGGKVAINNSYGKNQLGAFWPPRQVYIFDWFLKTLDDRQYNSGLAEVVKVGVLEQGKLLSVLESGKIPSSIELIKLCVKAKLKLIDDDWCEKKDGLRISLNFGHTIGHGLEKNYS